MTVEGYHPTHEPVNQDGDAGSIQRSRYICGTKIRLLEVCAGVLNDENVSEENRRIVARITASYDPEVRIAKQN